MLLKYGSRWRQFSYVVLYVVSLALASVVVHEGAHVIAALVLGVPIGELKPGFWGVNPAVMLPEWLGENARTVVFYAGGLTAGTALLLVCLLYWMRRYRRAPSLLYWGMGLATLLLAAEQLAAGYLEGRHHAAYVMLAPWPSCPQPMS